MIQRPESHSVHHGRGHHRNNYADLPLWDIIFGTFENPAEPATACGSWDGASYRISDMLLGRSIVQPPTENGARDAAPVDAAPGRQPAGEQATAA